VAKGYQALAGRGPTHHIGANGPEALSLASRRPTSYNKNVSGSVRFAHYPYMALSMCGAQADRSVCSVRQRGRSGGGHVGNV